MRCGWLPPGGAAQEGAAAVATTGLQRSVCLLCACCVCVCVEVCVCVCAVSFLASVQWRMHMFAQYSSMHACGCQSPTQRSGHHQELPSSLLLHPLQVIV
jgi:hypothetical protein